MVAEWKNVSYGVMLASYSLNVEKKAEEAWNSRRIRPQQIQLEITEKEFLHQSRLVVYPFIPSFTRF